MSGSSSTSEKKQVRVLTLGLDEDLLSSLKSELATSVVTSKTYSPQILEGDDANATDLIICGVPSTELSSIEVGQFIRMHNNTVPILFVARDRMKFHRKTLQKNGFTEAFLWPLDESFLKVRLREEISKIGNEGFQVFRPVQLIDVTPDSVLGFDLYIHLPANNKKIKYVSSHESLGEERAAKLREHQVKSALVSEDQMGQFYKFTAQQLKRLGSDSTMSETERKERKEKAVRDLLMGLWSESGLEETPEQGQQILLQCQEIVKAYILESQLSRNNWIEKFLLISNAEKTPYSHSGNTATLAALLSIALDIGNPSEVAMAGLLHDIGLADVPFEIVQKNDGERTPEEENLYREHPRHALKMIRSRKLQLPESVIEMIGQHHERYDGNGYPEKVPGPKIRKESQLLAVADEIDELTLIRPGVPRKSIPQAVDHVVKAGLQNPLASAIDPTLLRSLQSLFKKAA